MREVSATVAVKYMDIRKGGGVPWEPAWFDSPRPLPVRALASFVALFPCGRRHVPEEPPALDVGNSTSSEALPFPFSLDKYWPLAVCFGRFELEPMLDWTSPAH